MGKVANGQTWIQRHLKDPYVKQAQAEGYRSRASIKLLELQQRDKLFKSGMRIVDLGAAPGGWSQALSRTFSNLHIIALDLLPIDPLPNVTFIQGDFCDEDVLHKLEESLQLQKIDWVLSDMAPNMSGLKSVDQPRSLYLAELALDFAVKHLVKGGGLLIKAFQGSGFEEYKKLIQTHFNSVAVRKPKSSRAHSREVYLLARGFKL